LKNSSYNEGNITAVTFITFYVADASTLSLEKVGRLSLLSLCHLKNKSQV